MGEGKVLYRQEALDQEDDRPVFVEALNRAAGRNLSAIVGNAPGLGVNVCAVPSGKLVVHLVNYDLRFGKGQGATLTPAGNVQVAVPCPVGRDVASVHAYEVPEDGQSLQFTRCRDGVVFTVPGVRVYTIVEVALGPPEQPEAPAALAEVLGTAMPMKPGIATFTVAVGEGELLVPVSNEELTAVPTGKTWLRHAHQIYVLAKAGEKVELGLTAVRVHTYPDSLKYWVLSPGGEQLARGTIALGEKETISVAATASGVHTILADPARNACQVEVKNQYCSLPATKETPLQIISFARRHYFYVPEGVEAFSLFVSASGPNETAKVTVFSPDDEPVVEREGEFDKQEELEVQVPAGQDAKPWSFAIGKAKAGGLEDVTVYLSSDVPGFVADDAVRLLAPERHLK